MRGLFGGDFGRGNLVVAVNLDLQPAVNFPKPLDEVVGERVVVIDEENHGGRTRAAANRFGSFYTTILGDSRPTLALSPQETTTAPGFHPKPRLVAFG